MNELLQAAGPWTEWWCACLWRASWQGAIAIVLAWIVVRTCASLSPRMACWVWRLACLKLLAALIWVAPLSVPLLPANLTESAAIHEGQAPMPASNTAMRSQHTHGFGPATNAITPQSGMAIDWRGLILLAWLVGVGWQIVLIPRHLRGLRQLCASAEPVANADLRQTLLREAERLGVRRLPRLEVSPLAETPCLVGVMRPRIILPSHAEARFSTAELGLMLAHELAHLKRQDLLWNWLLVAVRSIFFFHPLVWIVAKRWSDAQEAACDELVLQAKVASASDYGRLLVKLSAGPKFGLESSLAAAGVLGSYRNLKRRILSMSHVRPYSRTRFWTASCIAVAVGALGIVPWQLTAQEAKNAKEDLFAAVDEMPPEQAIAAACDHLKTIMTAVHAYSADHGGKFPPVAIPNRNLAEAKQLSGLVLLLPYLGEKPKGLSDEAWQRYGNRVDEAAMQKAKELYGKIDRTKAWDDPANAEAAKTIVPTFLAPSSAPTRDNNGLAVSHFALIRGYAGNDTGVFDTKGVGLREMIDGTSKTLGIGQIHSELGPWLAAGPSTARYVYPPEDRGKNPTFGSQFSQGWLCAFADASPSFVDIKRAYQQGIEPIVGRNDRTVIDRKDYVLEVSSPAQIKELVSLLQEKD